MPLHWQDELRPQLLGRRERLHGGEQGKLRKLYHLYLQFHHSLNHSVLTIIILIAILRQA